MPYGTITRELPLEVKMMPKAAQTIWKAAFRGAVKERPDALAAMLAMNAVLKEFARSEDDEWVPRKSLERIDPSGGGDLEEGEEGAAGEGGEGDENDPEATEELHAAHEAHEVAKVKAKFRTARKAQTAASEAEAAAAAAAAAEATDSIKITETLTLDSKSFRLTEDGYLVAEPRVARTGIQLYKGFEVGRPDMDEVRVYRPENEVFDKRAMKSLAHRPITLGHPDTRVGPSNWRELSVGNTTTDVARDGEFIRVPLILMDAAAISAAQQGDSQLSVGYGAKLIWGDGVTPQGERFDAMQSEIRANHIALVTMARGGDKLKIGDAKRKGKHHDDGQKRRSPMSERTLTIDGVSITLEDKDGQILERHLSQLLSSTADLRKQLADAQGESDDLNDRITDLTKAVGLKDGEIVELKKQVEDGKLTPEQLDQKIDARMEVRDRATAFFGDQKYDYRNKSDAQIRRDVVAARHGDQKAKVMNDDAVEGAFLSITEPETQDGFQQMTKSFSRAAAHSNSRINDAAAVAYDKRNQSLQNAWKRNKGQQQQA